MMKIGQNQTAAQERLERTVNEMREAVLAEGLEITVSGYDKPIALQGRPQDRAALTELALMASLQTGNNNRTKILFRDRDNNDHFLTPEQLLEVWKKGAQYTTSVYVKSWEAKAFDPFDRGNAAAVLEKLKEARA